MKSISKIFRKFLCFIQPSSRAHFRDLMKVHCPRTKENFMREFESNPSASSVAERLYHILLNTWCPLDKHEFVPHLLDDISEDYGIVGMDLEELLFELLDKYDLPQKNIRGSDKQIVTVRDLIEFAVEVTRNHPLKNTVHAK